MPKLLRDLKSFWHTSRREHLPWRPPTLKLREGKADPYLILVSEVMLQQTQAERVIPFYERFITKFPTPQKLAAAPLNEVLQLWSGLGYNRRAKYLHEAAKKLAAVEFIKKGEMRQLSTEFLESLPGVGPYTARAVAAFAYNRPEIFVETNVRTVFIHYLFAKRRKLDSLVADAEILPLVAEVLKKSRMEPRDFYAALMDYGSFLKQKGIKLNSRSKHYTKQSKFEGSYRQLRGAVLRAILVEPKTIDELIDITSRKHGDVARVVANLAGEGMIKIKNKKISIAE